MYNLIAEFLTKNSDEELLDRFNSLIEKNQVYKLNFKDSKYAGMNIQSTINGQEKTIFLSTVVIIILNK